ncbi:MAG TPA: NAD(P)H-binding protein [Nocardioidaceae bacterium]|nr:NAD(P)H-binding protein [Nocardioidaceae bacterium]
MNTTLITGATGKTGRRVAERLTAMGRATKLGSRSRDVRFDWDDESTWAPALDGCTSAYITFAPDLAFPGAADTIERFAKTAVEAGTTRLVLLSGRGEEAAQLAEQKVIESGADWTVVRCAFFAQNFSESFWVESVQAGELALPGNTAEPMVDLEDVADVVVAALTDDRHIGRVYECTGPRLLTFDEAMAEIGAATGRAMSFRDQSPEEFAQDLVAGGLPEADAHGLAYLFVEILDGHNSYLTGGVQAALGREPRDFSDYVRRTADTGVWNG